MVCYAYGAWSQVGEFCFTGSVTALGCVTAAALEFPQPIFISLSKLFDYLNF